MPDDWRKSWIVNVYKGKGDAMESYRGIKLLDQVMKILERVVEKRIRSIVNIDRMQFGFRAGCGTTDAIFELLRWLGIAHDCVSDVVRRGRLRWFGHVERKEQEDWVSACRIMNVQSARARGRGRGRKCWQDCVNADMKEFGLTRDMTKDRAAWRSSCWQKRPTRAEHGKRT